METFNIKTHSNKSKYHKPHFFILNKGKNSGKPSQKPYTNCFVIEFNSLQDKDDHYWVAYSLWQSKFWHSHLIGSVISFLRIAEFKMHFAQRGQFMKQHYEKHLQNMQHLQLLDSKEANHIESIRLINDLRKLIFIQYFKE